MLVLKIAVVLLAVLAAVVAVGASLPVQHVAHRRVDLKQRPDTVYAIVRDVERYPEWWPDITRIDMLESRDSRVRFREHLRGGPIIIEIIEDAPPARMRSQIADPDQPFGGTWTFAIEATPTGARLIITEDGEIYNPFFRFMARFVLGYTGTMDSFLRALGTKLGEHVDPVS
jgi:hypothetical protein